MDTFNTTDKIPRQVVSECLTKFRTSAIVSTRELNLESVEQLGDVVDHS
jgi:hypothetical protein